MKFECLILNVTPFGPKDENGIGMNSFIQYIPLNKDSFKQTDRSKGYYISYCVVKDGLQKKLFQNFKSEDFLKPCVIELDQANKKYGNITSITFK